MRWRKGGAKGKSDTSDKRSMKMHERLSPLARYFGDGALRLFNLSAAISFVLP
jgi:hypothetical protein